MYLHYLYVQIATVCLALGMQVVATRRSVAKGAEFETVDMVGGSVKVYASTNLHAALRDTSVLMVCCPSTPETRGMIGKEELACLRDPAVLINVGRGDVIKESDLYEALVRGWNKEAKEFGLKEIASSNGSAESPTGPALWAAGIDTWCVHCSRCLLSVSWLQSQKVSMRVSILIAISSQLSVFYRCN